MLFTDDQRIEWTRLGLQRLKTKLLCKEHGLQPVADLVPDTLAVTLECECTRPVGDRTKRGRAA